MPKLDKKTLPITFVEKALEDFQATAQNMADLQNSATGSNSCYIDKDGKRRIKRHNLPDTEKTGIRSGLDWLTVSFPKISKTTLISIASFCRTWGGTGEKRKWGHGYTNGVDVALEGFCVWREAGDYYDACLVLPARALDYLRVVHGLDDWRIVWALDTMGAKATRADYAFDNYNKSISPMHIFQCLEEERILSQARQFWAVPGWVSTKTPKLAKIFQSIYLGRRGSPIQLRVYDKQQELEDKTGDKMEHCTRFEFECHDEAAQAIVKAILDGKTKTTFPRKFVCEILRGFFSVKKATGPKRLDRREDERWFADMMADGARGKYALQRGIATGERSVKWLNNQVVATVAAMAEAGLYKEFYDMCVKARERMDAGKVAQFEYYKDGTSQKDSVNTSESAT